MNLFSMDFFRFCLVVICFGLWGGSAGPQDRRPTALKTLLAEVEQSVDKEYPSLEKLYKHLHAHPELSFQEEQSAAIMAKEIDAREAALSELLRAPLMAADLELRARVLAQQSRKHGRHAQRKNHHQCKVTLHDSSTPPTLRLLASHRDIEGIDHDKRVQETRDDEERVGVLVGDPAKSQETVERVL